MNNELKHAIKIVGDHNRKLALKALHKKYGGKEAFRDHMKKIGSIGGRRKGENRRKLYPQVKDIDSVAS